MNNRSDSIQTCIVLIKHRVFVYSSKEMWMSDISSVYKLFSIIQNIY